VATFVDATETLGFIGLGGEADLAAAPGDAASDIPAAGTLSAFRGHLTASTTGSVTFTLYVNGAATAVACTIAPATTGCADGTHTVVLAAGDVIAVRITKSAGALLRHVRWSTTLAT
jgi:hypothetical protein